MTNEKRQNVENAPAGADPAAGTPEPARSTPEPAPSDALTGLASRKFRSSAELTAAYQARDAELLSARDVFRTRAQSEAAGVVGPAVAVRDKRLGELQAERDLAASRLKQDEILMLRRAKEKIRGRFESLRNQLAARIEAKRAAAHAELRVVTDKVEPELAAKLQGFNDSCRKDRVELKAWYEATVAPLRMKEAAEEQARKEAAEKAVAAPVAAPAPAAPAAPAT